MAKIFVFLVASGVAFSAPAAFRDNPAYSMYLYTFDRLRDDINKSAAASTAECSNEYSRLFPDQVIRMYLAFGYEDQAGDPDADTVLDPFTSQAVHDHLIEPCSGPYSACGFEETEDPFILTKKMSYSNGEKKRVELRITHSAFTARNSANTGSYGYEQSAQSFSSEQSLIEGLETGQVVFYSGHSRDGGGPDFRPPKLLKDGHPDYGWYRAHHPGLDLMMNALKRRQGQMPLLGLFSCSSRGHFFKTLFSNFQGIPLILGVRDLPDYDSETYVVGGLNAVLSQLCSVDFTHSLNSKEVAEQHKFEIYNFFNVTKPPKGPVVTALSK